MGTQSLFEAQRLTKAVTRITDLTGGLIYLIEGNTKALLVDTGVGVGDLRAFVDSLTALPLEVVLTHGHMDHTAGAPQFPLVYLHPKDFDLCGKHNEDTMRQGYLAMIRPDVDLAHQLVIPNTHVDMIPLSNGQQFDLGGIHVRALEMPGHTQGSVSILIEEERSVIFGDACNVFTFLFSDECSTVREYLASLLDFKQRYQDLYDTVYLSHGGGDVDNKVLDGVVEVCQGLLDGISDQVPFEFMGEHQLIAKATDPATRARLDGRVGNVVYNTNSLR